MTASRNTLEVSEHFSIAPDVSMKHERSETAG